MKEILKRLYAYASGGFYPEITGLKRVRLINAFGIAVRYNCVYADPKNCCKCTSNDCNRRADRYRSVDERYPRRWWALDDEHKPGR